MVYYRGLPNWYFVAGAVFDPEADECLEDCKVILIEADGTTDSLQTDEFGDFWFERRKPGTYSLRVEKEGYLTRTIEDIEVSKDINVGDIELHTTSQDT